MERESLIKELSGNRGYAFLTQEQKNRVNATNITPGNQGLDAMDQPIGRVSEITSVSTDRGVDLLNRAKATEARITPLPQPAPEASTRAKETAVTEKPTGGKVTLLNPTTGQSISYDDAAINRENIQANLASGYQLSEASGSLPSWLTTTPRGAAVRPKSALETQAEKDQAEYDASVSKLKNFAQEVSNDPALLAILENVSAAWDARIKEQEQSNKSRSAAMQTAGYRLGSRYAGGNVGPMAGIISAEEKAGMARIDDLTRQKQSALAEARSAFESKKWEQYAKFVDLAESKLSETKKAIAELNKANAEEDKKRKERQTLLDGEERVFDVVSLGAKDKKDVYKALRGVVDTKTIDDVWDRIYDEEADPTTKVRLDVLKSAVGNGATSDVIDAIRNAPTGEDAITAAGTYLKAESNPGGIVGEYLFYKKDAEARGVKPLDFDSYQTMDVNRKRSIAAAGVANAQGLTPQQNQTFLRITDNFQKDEFIKRTNQGASAIAIADQVLKNPGSATNQLMVLYTLVKSLDPESAVREGELDLAQKTQSYLAKFGTRLDRISKGKLIDNGAATELANATKVLATEWYNIGKRREKQYRAQAKGGNIGQAFDSYLNDSDLIYREESPVIQEAEAKQRLVNYGKDNPQAQEQIRQLLKEYNPQDALQILGI